MEKLQAARDAKNFAEIQAIKNAELVTQIKHNNKSMEERLTKEEEGRREAESLAEQAVEEIKQLNSNKIRLQSELTGWRDNVGVMYEMLQSDYEDMERKNRLEMERISQEVAKMHQLLLEKERRIANLESENAQLNQTAVEAADESAKKQGELMNRIVLLLQRNEKLQQEIMLKDEIIQQL